MRSLAEMAAAAVLDQLGRPATANSRERVVPGAEGYPSDKAGVKMGWQQIAERTGFSELAVSAVWNLCGTRTESLLVSSNDQELLPDVDLPCSVVRWSIEHEYARTVADLVERRLMLLYHQRLTKACLRRLAELLAEAGVLPAADVGTATTDEVSRLQARYAKRVE